VRQRLMSKALSTLIPFYFLVLYMIIPCPAWAWTGRVVDVAAGETITVLKNGKSVEVLLYGIDCPDEGQPFSNEAKQLTSKMVFGKVSADKSLLNEELVKAGLAWVYNRYCHEVICETWKHYQLRAKIDERGFWSEPQPISPWKFRRKK
jgi:micrococcal nuclease